MVHMDITQYVEGLHRDLAATAAAGGPEVTAAAERLAYALESSVRLMLMEALTAAADDITSQLAAGSVEVRLRGREPEFVVDVPAPTPAPSAMPTAGAPADDALEDDSNVVRITLRLPESLKTRAEQLAAKSGQSLNTWLVNAARLASNEGAINIDLDLSSLPFGNPAHGWQPSGKRRMSGWV